MLSKKINLLVMLWLIFTASWLWGEKIELKNGTTVTGTVKEIKDGKVFLDLGESKELGIALEEITPHSVYLIRRQVIEPTDAQAHWELGKYCLEHKLYNYAQQEFTRAAESDESFKEQTEKKINALKEQESIEVIDNAFALMRADKYKEALENLRELINKYPDSKYTEEATRAATFATQVIRHEIKEETKHKEMEKRKEEQERQAKKETGLREKYKVVVKLINEARIFNIAGLNYEGDYKVKPADKSYQQALEKLLPAKALLVSVLNQTRDVNLMSDGKDKIREINGWLVIVYNNLGQLCVMELNFRKAIKWLNKALALNPTHKSANDLKVKIIEMEALRKLRLLQRRTR